jgi:hypothetical protein
MFDRAAVQQVIEMERYWRDRRQWERQRACYTDDCIVSAGWFQGTADDFVARSKDMALRKGFDSVFHYLWPISIRTNGGRALAESSTQVIIRFSVDGIEIDYTGMTRAFSRLIRSESGWRIASLHGIYQKDSIAPALPWQTIPIREEELRNLRPSYRMNSWLMSKLGYTPSQEMLGDDRPEELDAFYRRAESWMAEEM